ncbi:MAG: amino acid permease [Actinomycetota bacterium]
MWQAFRIAANEVEAGEEAHKLSTFGGVFTPSLLTILGLVLFLRLGFVTGSVGVGQMLLILGLSSAVSVLTTISLAAIATNLRVGGGGVYFLLSRTLGPQFGGAIGLVLYLAMSVSVAFYTIGLGEAVASIVGADSALFPRFVAAGTVVVLLGLAWLGADIATRFQYVVMVCLAVAIVAYFAGVLPDLDPARLGDNFGRPPGDGAFWVSFAIFFPAITGFTQGVAMSGDLKTPSRSISVGTFGAIGVSTLVYVLVILSLGMAVTLDDLRDDTAIMRSLSLRPWLVDVGVMAATLSSAIASIMGAPRTLQRLAADRLIKPLEPFAKGSGADDNPRLGASLSAGIALITIALGDLDVVAPVISMFFLASYGMINYATYSEARAASTSFRPRFRYFDWRLSMLGTIACLGVILAIDPLAGALAGVAVFMLYRWLQQSIHEVRWADSTRGFHASQVRSHLKQMGAQPDPSRDWRPCTVAFVPRNPERRKRLVAVASWLEGAAGFTTVARIIVGSGALVRKKAAQVDVELQRELAERNDGIYGRVVVGETIESGVAAMLQAHGLGSVRPNLALYSWHDPDVSWGNGETDGATAYTNMVRTGLRHGCNVAIVHADDESWTGVMSHSGRQGRVAVWWTDDRTGQLLTMLAWMCTRSPTWAGAEIDVWVAGDTVDHDELARVAGLLDDARLPVRVAGRAKPSSFVDRAGRASLVFAPMRITKGHAFGPNGVDLDELGEKLPVVVFAQAVAPVELDVQPDDDRSAALAVAHDRAERLSDRADELSEVAARLMVEAELIRIERPVCIETDDAVASADKEAAAAQRAYLDARTRADEAWRVVAGIDPSAANGRVDPELWVNTDDAAESSRERRRSRLRRG